MDTGVPWWGVAAITAVASLFVGLTAAVVNWSSKTKEIRATDRRQWDQHKYETVAKFMALCDKLAEVTWASDPKGQEETHLAANQERLRLLLMSQELGPLAYNLLESAKKQSQAPNEYERKSAISQKEKASEILIERTQRDIARG